MTHAAIGLAALVFGAAATVGVQAETIRGVLVDKACYERDSRNTGQKHADRPLDECARTCAKYGLPLAVLTTDGKLYQVIGDLAAKRNAKMADYVTRTVEVTGAVTKDAEGQLRIDGTSIKPVI